MSSAGPSRCRGQYSILNTQYSICCMKYDVLIVGAGPAGIFAALQLVKEKSGSVCIIDSGPDIDQRYRKTGLLSGWGGAGAFSDGKITLSP